MRDAVANGLWQVGEAEFDASTGILRSAAGQVSLDRSCRAILLALIKAEGEPISKDELLELGWPGRIVHENSLAKAVSRLRQALGVQGEALQALYGRGYCLTLPVQLSSRSEAQAMRAGQAARPRMLSGMGMLALALIVVALAAVVASWYAQRDQAHYQQQADALLSFLVDDVLASADPYHTQRLDDASLREIVERTVATVDVRFAGQPAAQMALHRVLARAFGGWGEYDKAVNHYDRAQVLAKRLFGVESAETVPLDIALCHNMRLSGATRRAEPVCERAEQHAQLRAPELLADARIARAKLLFETGDYAQAVSMLVAVRQSGGALTDAQQADAAWFLGLCLRKLARYDQAEEAFLELLDIRERAFGKNHPLTAWAYADYGDFLVAAGRFEQAEALLEQAQQAFDNSLGPAHLESMTPAYSMAEMRQWQGRHDEARALLRPILARYREALGSDHHWTLYSMTELAWSEAMVGQHQVARALLHEARKTGERILYGRAGKAAYFHMMWTQTLIELGELSAAAQELQLARAAHAQDAPNPWLSYTECVAARLALAQAKPALAETHAQACQRGLQQAVGLPPSYPGRQEAERLLSMARQAAAK